MPNFRLCGATHPGLVRRVNEDSFCLCNRGMHINAFAAVADGIGGHNQGDVASELVCHYLLTGINAPDSPLDRTSPDEVASAMKALLCSINDRLVMANTLRQNTLPMGCTIVAAVFLAEKIVVLHAGDSRFYEHCSDGTVIRHTVDHSLWATMMRKNNLPPDTPVPGQLANIIMNAMGTYSDLHLAVQVLDFHADSGYLLCSDGLYHDLGADEMNSILARKRSRRETVELLLRRTMDAGASDNVTVVYGNSNPE